MKYDGDPHIYYPLSSHVVYRLKPAKIRADEVPMGRKFKRDVSGSIYTRIPVLISERVWAIYMFHGRPETWSLSPNDLVTLLAEDQCII